MLEPLDLRAVETEAKDCIARFGDFTRTDRELDYARLLLDVLAALRATRAALQATHDWLYEAHEEDELQERAAAVLASVKNEP